MMHSATELFKFKKLVRALCPHIGECHIEPTTVAVGVLERLWHCCLRNSRDGYIGKKLDNDEIAESVGWLGDSTILIDALVGTGWLDITSAGLKIHDWEEHMPNFAKGVLKKKKARLEKASKEGLQHGGKPEGKQGQKPDQIPGGEPGYVPGLEPGSDPPNKTKSNQTNPTTTTENKMAIERRSTFLGNNPGSCPSSSSVDLEVVKEQMGKLKRSKTMTNVFTDREVWELAYGAVAVGNLDFCSMIVESLKSGKVGNTKSYVLGAFRKIAAEGGGNHVSLRNQGARHFPGDVPVS